MYAHHSIPPVIWVLLQLAYMVETFGEELGRGRVFFTVFLKTQQVNVIAFACSLKLIKLIYTNYSGKLSKSEIYMNYINIVIDYQYCFFLSTANVNITKDDFLWVMTECTWHDQLEINNTIMFVQINFTSIIDENINA